MSEPPFGFGMPGQPGDDPDHGSQGPSGPAGVGPFGDPQQLADALRQFADLMSYQGGPVNWDLAKDIARQTVSAKGDPSVLDNERNSIVEAVRVADLWLEDATMLPSGIRSVQAWSRSEWVEATLPVWSTLCEPIAERAVESMSGLLAVNPDDLGDLPPEMRSAMSALTGGAGELRRMAVGGELLDERPSEVRISLDDENRLAAGVRSCCCLLAADAGGADGNCLRAHATSAPVYVRVAWRERARWFEGESPYRRLNARAK